MYNTVIFDMDGTVADSFSGIAVCVRYALDKFGIAPPTDREVRRYVGPPLLYSFMKYAGFSELQAMTAKSYYAQKYDEVGVDGTTIYEGIPRLLADLKARGVRLAIASTKIEVNVGKVLKKHGLSDFFEFAGGSDPTALRNEKHEVISHVLKKLGNQDKSSCVLVGDRSFDLEGAQQCGIDCIGVLYGYGSRDELGKYKSVAIVKDVAELSDYLLSNV